MVFSNCFGNKPTWMLVGMNLYGLENVRSIHSVESQFHLLLSLPPPQSDETIKFITDKQFANNNYKFIRIRLSSLVLNFISQLVLKLVFTRYRSITDPY